MNRTQSMTLAALTASAQSIGGTALATTAAPQQSVVIINPETMPAT